MTKESFNIIHGWPDLGYYYFPSQPPFSMEINFYGALHFSSKRNINQSGGAKNVALLYAGEKLEQENIRFKKWIEPEDSLYYWWFKFLKLNPRYESLCKILRQFPDFALQVKGGFGQQDPCYEHFYEAGLLDEQEPELFKKRIYLGELLHTYHFFGDIHDDKFKGKQGFYNWWVESPRTIDDEAFREHRDTWDLMWKKNKVIISRGAYLFASWGRANNLRLLTTNEVMRSLENGDGGDSYYVRIDPNLTLNEIDEQLTQLQQDIENDIKLKNVKEERQPLLKLRGNSTLNTDNIKNWYKAYELYYKKGKNALEIGYQLSTNEEMDRHEIKKGFDGSCPTYRKKGERFLNSAKININNAAMGKFPVPLLEK
ncbi:hypothetical protein OAC68_02805 [Gammaproteobacteria bacterium]|nr:hypothetical protein [Gammaproteobacteria bacterium]|tara:strand:+ start:365 stop:1474 length:1110 start_codon:yes stop_codon:yes gene_type:complete